MRVQHRWWSGLVAVMLGGLVGVTVVAAAGEQFIPILSSRQGGQRLVGIPIANGTIDYLTLLNERNGGINGVKLVWEDCDTVYDVDRSVECYERLKAKGSTGAAVFHPPGTHIVYALLERAARGRLGWAGVSICLPRPDQLVESEHGQNPLHWPAGWRHGAAQGPESCPCLLR
jgi:hypothetical protein